MKDDPSILDMVEMIEGQQSAADLEEWENLINLAEISQMLDE